MGLSPSFEIGPFRLEPEAGVLLRAGQPTRLGPRAVAVLTVLVERANEYVQKASIMDAAWPGVVVEETNLAMQISAIRRVLAEASGGESWVETLARRGYRFVGPVTKLPDNLGRAPRTKGGRSNLPELRTSFIGRERELAGIKQLLAGTRLLTLVGTGGVGKTRVALQVVPETMAAYRDGVWLVELGATGDPALVPTCVSQAFGVREASQKPVLDTLCAYVKSRQLLLLLDNCEHVLDACAKLADALLCAGPELTIIATSREPLRIAGEQIYPLPTLSLPDPLASPEVAACSESVQLFIDRARAAGPCFGLNGGSPSVAAICRRLDGIPLAIEMAAARAPTLGLEKLAQKLDESFRMLTLGWCTTLPRHQTLRATLDWSYGLLAEAERTVLRRLAVFRNTFTLKAASSVASDEAIDGLEVMGLLSQLVARSLVVAHANQGGVRYRLLEVTRAYALEKLAEAEETVAIQRRHANYFRDMFAHAPDDWLRLPDTRFHDIYVSELDNVRSALDWCLSAEGEPALGIALAGASGRIWEDLGLISEGRQRLDAAAAQVGPQTPETDEAHVWRHLASICTHEAPSMAVAAAERAAELYRRSGDPLGRGISLVDLGAALGFMGRFDRAALALTEARPLLEGSGLPKALATYHSGSGFLAALSGESATARAHYENALALYRRAGAAHQVLRMLVNLAHVIWALGDLEAALTRCREAIEQLRESQPTNNVVLAFTLAYVSGIHTERGEVDDALATARECLPLLSEAGCAWNLLDDFALLAGMAGNVTGAATVAGYTDAMYAAKAAARPPNVARSRSKVEALLRERLPPGDLEHLLAEGAKMTEEEACRAMFR